MLHEDRHHLLPAPPSPESLEELVRHHRAALAALPAGAPELARGRLHLAIGAALAGMDGQRTEEAVEELRQALQLLPEAEARLERAEARLHLGRELLLRGSDRSTRTSSEEAAYHLERAYRGFEEAGLAPPRVMAARLLAAAKLELAGLDAARRYLEDTSASAEGELRTLLEIDLADIYLADANPAIRGRGQSMLAAHLDSVSVAGDAAKDAITGLLGAHGLHLPRELQERALSWLESQPDAPLDLLLPFRSRVRSGEERWVKPEERARLQEQMDDVAQPIRDRCRAAYVLIGALPPEERSLRRRAIDLLETHIESEELHPTQRLSYRHDLAVAMKLIGENDLTLLRRAAQHLQAVRRMLLPQDRAVATSNLSMTLLRILEIEAKVSSPALLPVAGQLEDLANELPRDRAWQIRLTAATYLLHADAFTHPECLEAAGDLIDRAVAQEPDNPHAARMRYWHTWIRHQQGNASAAELALKLERARRLGPVEELQLMDGLDEIASRALAGALAGGRELAGVDLRRVAGVVRMRPDGVEVLLSEIERRLAAPGATAATCQEFLDVTAEIMALAPGGDQAAQGRLLRGIFEQCAQYIPADELRHHLDMMRGPAAAALSELFPQAGETTSSTRVDAGWSTLERRVQQLHREGVALLDEGRKRLGHDRARAADSLREAIEVLDRARALAREAAPLQRALVQISAGNARRLLSSLVDADAGALLEQAEALYREALPWTVGDPSVRARLDKVLADCLILRTKRGDPGTWAEAMGRYQAALQERRGGYMRWETIFAAADGELVAPSRDQAASLKAALARLEEAMEHAPTADHKTVTATRMLELLSRMPLTTKVDRHDRDRVADIVAEACPALAAEARMAAQGLSFDSTAAMDIDHDARRTERKALRSAFMMVLVRSMQMILEPPRLESFPPEHRDGIRAAVQEGRVQLDADRRSDPAALRAEVERLGASTPVEDTEEKAARLVARARILEHLLSIGQDVLAAHAEACAAAEAAVQDIADPGIRALALAELSRSLQHRGPGGDFICAARLLEQALACCPADWTQTQADIVGTLAHATRFRPDLPAAEAIDRAIAGYTAALVFYQKVGSADGVVNMLQNLAEAVESRDDRPVVAKLREARELELEAIRIARTKGGEKLGELLGNLAWTLTQLADALGVGAEERRICLEQAGPAFEEALSLVKSPDVLQSIRNNHLQWRSAMQPDGVVQDLRARLRGLDPAMQPREWSMTAHNLAEELWKVHTGILELREAISLYRQALELRPLHAEPRFHWESSQSLGDLLAGIYRRRSRVSPVAFGLSISRAREEAAERLRAAIRAARSLGSGPKLVRAARSLGLLAADVDPDAMPELNMAGEALAAIDEVLGLAPEERTAGDAEAEVATAVAGALALNRAKTAPILGVTTTDAMALHGAAAWEVLHWMLRARGGQHRRLRGRMARPAGVPPEVWTAWRLALRGRENWEERRAAAAAVRSAAPSFLAGAPDLAETMAWLRAARGAAATLLETPMGWLLGVIAPWNETIGATVILLGEVEPFGLHLGEIVMRLRAPAELEGKAREDALTIAQDTWRTMARWLQRHVLPDLRARLPADLEVLLWSPHGAAGAIPLGLVAEDIPSIWTTPCITLPPPLPARQVPSALLVLADPEPPGSDQAILGGMEEMASIARDLAPMVPRLEVLLGHGGSPAAAPPAGVDVPGLLRGVVPTPSELRRRLAEHRLVIVLAHGIYDAEHPEQSRLTLLDNRGQPAELSAGDLAEIPDLLREATIVLLSCELGQGGGRSAAPEGLAGVLLAVGARAVVAPLWPVLSDGALRIGNRMARAAANGIDLGRALQAATQLVRGEVGEDRGEAGLYGLGPFIAWTG